MRNDFVLSKSLAGFSVIWYSSVFKVACGSTFSCSTFLTFFPVTVRITCDRASPPRSTSVFTCQFPVGEPLPCYRLHHSYQTVVILDLAIVETVRVKRCDTYIRSPDAPLRQTPEVLMTVGVDLPTDVGDFAVTGHAKETT